MNSRRNSCRQTRCDGAVLIEGPKYCGKTTLACQHAKSVLYMADPATRTQNLILARTNIARLLDGPTPRLIDEWQPAPQFWDAVRNTVPRRNKDGQFILTGSLVEIKLGRDRLIEEGATNLKKLADKIDTGKMQAPSFLMVLTGIGQYAYRRPHDGIPVVPIGSLRN